MASYSCGTLCSHDKSGVLCPQHFLGFIPTACGFSVMVPPFDPYLYTSSSKSHCLELGSSSHNITVGSGSPISPHVLESHMSHIFQVSYLA